MGTQYIIMSIMLMSVLMCSTIGFAYFGWASSKNNRPLSSCFSWVACGVYFGVTALSGFVFWG